MQVITAYDDIRRRLKTVMPSMSYQGENLLSWQQKAREKLRLLLGMDRLEKAEPLVQVEYDRLFDTYREIRFLFQSEDGYAVPCHLVLPVGVEKPPVVIALQGHVNGMHLSLGHARSPEDEAQIEEYRIDFCLQAVKEGMACVTMEQRNFGECDGRSGEIDEPVCYSQSMTALLMGRTTIGERVWDVMRLIDTLEQEFHHLVDLKKLICMGLSGGGTATIYAAALEDRIRIAVPVGAMASYTGSIGAMNHCVCNYVPHIAEYFDMSDLMTMAYPKCYVQVSGDEDPIFPYDTAVAMFEKGKDAYGEQGDRCTLVTGHGGHKCFPEETWPVVRNYLKEGL